MGEEELFQLGEIGGGDVGNRAEGKAILLPCEPVVALGFAGAIPRVFRLGFFHEDIDDMLAASVDECGDGAATGSVEASTEQGKSIVREVAHGRREIDSSVEPRLDGVLIGGFDICKMAGLQGAEMCVHEGCSHKLAIGETKRPSQQIPANQGDK